RALHRNAAFVAVVIGTGDVGVAPGCPGYLCRLCRGRQSQQHARSECDARMGETGHGVLLRANSVRQNSSMARVHRQLTGIWPSASEPRAPRDVAYRVAWSNTAVAMRLAS